MLYFQRHLFWGFSGAHWSKLPLIVISTQIVKKSVTVTAKNLSKDYSHMNNPTI